MATHEELVKTVNDLMMSVARLSDDVCKLRIMIIELDPALRRTAAPWVVSQTDYGTGETP